MTDEIESGTASGSGRETRGGFFSRVPAILLMALVLVVAATLSAVTAMKFAIQGQEVEVPDLAGSTEADAALRLGELDLALVVDSRRFSAEVPDGEIFDQSPRPGARVKRDRSVRVRVSLGEREFAVPDLRGTSLRSAQLQLVERGLATGSTLYSHSEEAAAGTVLFQDPDPGDQESDPAVDVLVSLGPVGQYFVMPSLAGLSVSESRRRIRAAGFRMSEIPAQATGVPAGRVVSQQPPAGHRISTDDTIVVGVSQ